MSLPLLVERIVNYFGDDSVSTWDGILWSSLFLFSKIFQKILEEQASFYEFRFGLKASNGLKQ